MQTETGAGPAGFGAAGPGTHGLGAPGFGAPGPGAAASDPAGAGPALPDPALAGLADEALFERFMAGRAPEDFEALIGRHQRFCYRVAQSVCNNAALAEEALQETYAYLARGKTSYANRGPGSFRRWLFGVTVNMARRAKRGERRVQVREESREFKAVAARTAEGRQAAPADQALGHAERVQAVREALQSLDERFRLAVVLHLTEGVPQLEIGRLLGVSQAQVSRYLTQGLEALRRRLAAAGLALSAAGLPDLLEQHPDFQVPDRLGAGLRQLLQRTPASRPSWWLRNGAWLAAGTSAVALAGAAWWWAAGSGKKPPAAEGSAAPVASAAALPAEAQTLPRRWDFAAGPAEGLDCLAGRWSWVRGHDGTGGMLAARDEVALVMPCVELPRRPVVLSLACRDADQTWQFSFGAGWISGELEAAAHRYYHNRPRLNTGRDKLTQLQVYFFDRWAVTAVDGQLSTLREFEQAYPAGRVLLKLMNLEVKRLELRAIEPDEIPGDWRDPEKLKAGMQHGPVSFPRHRLNAGP